MEESCHSCGRRGPDVTRWINAYLYCARCAAHIRRRALCNSQHPYMWVWCGRHGGHYGEHRAWAADEIRW